MEFRFVPIVFDGPSITDPELTNKEVRAHAASAGVRSARRNRKKSSPDIGKSDHDSNTEEGVSEIRTLTLLPKEARLARIPSGLQPVSLKGNVEWWNDKQFAAEGIRDTLFDLSPPPLISAHINCPEYLQICETQATFTTGHD